LKAWQIAFVGLLFLFAALILSEINFLFTLVLALIGGYLIWKGFSEDWKD